MSATFWSILETIHPLSIRTNPYRPDPEPRLRATTVSALPTRSKPRHLNHPIPIPTKS